MVSIGGGAKAKVLSSLNHGPILLRGFFKGSGEISILLCVAVWICGCKSCRTDNERDAFLLCVVVRKVLTFHCFSPTASVKTTQDSTCMGPPAVPGRGNNSSSSSSGHAVQVNMPAETPQISSSSVKSARELLAQSAQEIVQELNNKRAQDSQMMADFKAGLDLHVSVSSGC